jgi:hypothetical protein
MNINDGTTFVLIILNGVMVFGHVVFFCFWLSELEPRPTPWKVSCTALGLQARIVLVAVLALWIFGAPILGLAWGRAEGAGLNGVLAGLLVGGVGSAVTLSGLAFRVADGIAGFLREGLEVDRDEEERP